MTASPEQAVEVEPTLQQLIDILPLARKHAPLFIEHLNHTMFEFGINNIVRRAAFIAQIGHESGQLRYLRELASGDAYEGRGDLGNIYPGDGQRFKGRGLIQVTGRFNYDACGKSLGLDLISHPQLLEQPEHACRSAGWFWDLKKLNALADTGDFLNLTRRINGGLNGLNERRAFFNKALEVLST
ncbi:glycoside hydrolase family 19 protein [Pseudomonas koreensis]|uniref:glycoside hydrolase family 19 protein n=1 Tax=Pseudomonas koreensis TaxID=198620 RepID=UPI003F854F22